MGKGKWLALSSNISDNSKVYNFAMLNQNSLAKGSTHTPHKILKTKEVILNSSSVFMEHFLNLKLLFIKKGDVIYE